MNGCFASGVGRDLVTSLASPLTRSAEAILAPEIGDWTRPAERTSLKVALRAAAPAAFVAAFALFPFLRKAFSVEDVTFLFQATHVLVDPLHPTAFNMVFEGERIRLSQHLAA